MAFAPDTSTYLLLNSDATDLPNSLNLVMGSGLILNNTGPGGKATITLAGILNSLIDIPSTTTGLLSKTSFNSINPVSLVSAGSTITITNGDGAAANPNLEVTPLTTAQLIQLQLGGTPVGTPQQAINFVSNSSISWNVTEASNIYTVSATAPANAAASWAEFPAIQEVDISGLSLSNVRSIGFPADGIFPAPSAFCQLSVYSDGTNYVPALTLAGGAGGTNYYLPLSNVIAPVIGDIFTCVTAGSYSVVSPGTAGYVLTSNGPGQIPSYQASSVESWSTVAATSDVNMNGHGLTGTTTVTFNDSALPTFPAKCLSSYDPSTTASLPVWTNQNSNYYLPLSTVENAAVGDLICSIAGTTYGTIAASTSGFVLTSTGPGSVPSWQNPQSVNWSSVIANQDVNFGNNNILNAKTINVGDNATTVSTYALSLNPTSSSASMFMGRSTPPATLTVDGGVLSVDTTDLLHYTNQVNGYTVALSTSLTGSVAGDILVGNGVGGGFTPLALGANTYVLTSNGTTAVWAPASGGGGGGSTWSTYPATQNVNFATYEILNTSGITTGSATPGAYPVNITGSTAALYFDAGPTSVPALGKAAGVVYLDGTYDLPCFTGNTTQFRFLLGGFTVPTGPGAIPIGNGPTGGDTFDYLAPGTSGYVLTSTGTTTAPTWQAPSGGSGWPTVAATAALNFGNQNLLNCSNVAIGRNDTTASVFALELSAASGNAQLYIDSSAVPTLSTITGSGTVLSNDSGNLIVSNANGSTLVTGIPQRIQVKAFAYNNDTTDNLWLPAFTYNNGTNGLDATIIFTGFSAVSSDYTDNIDTAQGDIIAYIDLNATNKPYSGVYVVSQKGNGTVQETWTRIYRYCQTSNMTAGTELYCPKINLQPNNTAVSVLGGCTFTQLTSSVTVGTTPIQYEFSHQSLPVTINIAANIPNGVATSPLFTLPKGRSLYPTSISVISPSVDYTAIFYPNATTNPAWTASTTFTGSLSNITTVPIVNNALNIIQAEAVTINAPSATPAVTMTVNVSGYVSLPIA